MTQTTRSTEERNLRAWERGAIWERARTPEPKHVLYLTIDTDAERGDLWIVTATLVDGSTLELADATTKTAAGAFCRLNYSGVSRRYAGAAYPNWPRSPRAAAEK